MHADIPDEGHYQTSYLARLWRTPSLPDVRQASWEYNANIFSKISFSWAFRLIRTAASRRLELQDFPLLNPDRSCQSMTDQLKLNFEYHLNRGSRQPLLRAIERTCRFNLWFATAVGAFATIIDYANIVTFYVFWRYLQECRTAHLEGRDGPSYTSGIYYTTVIVMLQAVASLADVHTQYRLTMAANEIQTALIGFLSDKYFTLDPNAPVKARPDSHSTSSDSVAMSRRVWDSSSVMTSATVHAERLSKLFVSFIWICNAIMSIPLVVTIVWWQMGWFIALIMSAIMIASEGGAMFLTTYAVGYQNKANDYTDDRAAVLDGLLHGIRLIKLFGWEEYFYRAVTYVRRTEIAALREKVYYSNIFGTPRLGEAFAPLIAYILFHHQHTTQGNAAIVVVSLAYLVLDRHAWKLAVSVNDGLIVWPSVARCTAYFASKDYHRTSQGRKTPNGLGIMLTNALFSWASHESPDDLDEAAPLLPNDMCKIDTDYQFRMSPLSIKFGSNELVAVVGPIQAGKTSLLQGLVGDMPLRAGSMAVDGIPAYCSQESWIQNTTVKDNITFGLPFDADVYSAVLDACALRPDIWTFPALDRSLLGENGVTLSGGQKSRLHLARTLYQAVAGNRKVVLLDDPLSDVDAKTSNVLFSQAVYSLLKDKCRVMITHQLHILSRCDRVIFLRDGRIVADGTYAELSSNAQFADFAADAQQSKSHEEKAIEKPASKNFDEVQTHDAVRVIAEEERADYRVPWQLYSDLIGGPGMKAYFGLLTLVLFGSQIGFSGTQLQAAWWNAGHWDPSLSTNASIYFVLVMLNLLCWGPYAVTIQWFFQGRGLYWSDRALLGVLRAPITFFEERVISTMVNRFTHDINTLDQNLGFHYWEFSLNTMIMTCLMASVAVHVPIVLSLVLPLVLFGFAVFLIFKTTPLEIKRLAVNLSTNYLAVFSEGLSGRTPLTLAQNESEFRGRLFKQIDDYNSVHFLSAATFAWATLANSASFLVMMWLSGLLVLEVRQTTEPAMGVIVLALITASQSSLQAVLTEGSAAQNGINALERLKHYAQNLPDEGERLIQDPITSERKVSWPSHGAIEFKNISLRYRPGLPLALRDLTMSIDAGEKIGIVGRTGAGKSTILMALLRLIKLAQGQIVIDGVDISTVGLHDVRQNIATIPQDPVLFLGTVRFNLDPTGQIPDERLEAALREVHLVGDQAEGKPGALTLDTPVEREGRNFSSGQRQLLSLARALAKKSKVIVIDEATSSVDARKDLIVQKTIREVFADCTVLTIAHRLKTVLRYDRICVMDSGRVAEMGRPEELFEKEDGMFRALCEQASISAKDF